MRERILTPTELNQLMHDTLKLIDGDERLLPKTDEYKGVSDLYIEIGRYGYEYVCKERGEEIFRKVPLDLNDLLYEVFCHVTYYMVLKDKGINQISAKDQRQFLLDKQLILLKKLSPKWAERKGK